MSTKKLQILGTLGDKIYTQNEEPVDASDGALWVDLDETSSSPSIIPTPTDDDNGKFLGCEGGKAAWLPVEAGGGGDKWELIDTIPLVKDTIVYEIASLADYKKIAIVQDKAILSVNSSGNNWFRVASETGYTIKQMFIDGSAMKLNISFWAVIHEGSVLKFLNWSSGNNASFRTLTTNYFMTDMDLSDYKIQVILSETNAANINTEASFNVYGVRR